MSILLALLLVKIIPFLGDLLGGNIVSEPLGFSVHILPYPPGYTPTNTKGNIKAFTDNNRPYQSAGRIILVYFMIKSSGRGW